MPLSQRQREYLQLMGIPVWKERLSDEVSADTHALASELQEGKSQEQSVAQRLEPDSSVSTEHVAEAVTESIKKQEVFVAPQDVLKRDELPDDWSKMIDVVASCTRCELHQSRSQTVFGAGNIEADWMLIGEAPGIDEDKMGEPFSGQSGDLLTSILKSIGLSRQQVYMTNALKCLPPNKREPKPAEAAQCRAYLEQQIAMVDPKVILCVGRIAAQYLLDTKDPLSRIRGKVHEMIHPTMPEKNISIIATYHPAYLLRSPSQKRKVWDDLKLAYSVVH